MKQAKPTKKWRRRMVEKTITSEIEEVKALYPEARDGCPQATDEDVEAWKSLRYTMQERDR